MLDTKNIPDFLIFFDLASYRLFVVQHFGYCGLVYDFGHLVNCHKLTSDQRRLIVRYLYLRFATGTTDGCSCWCILETCKSEISVRIESRIELAATIQIQIESQIESADSRLQLQSSMLNFC